MQTEVLYHILPQNANKGLPSAAAGQALLSIYNVHERFFQLPPPRLPLDVYKRQLLGLSGCEKILGESGDMTVWNGTLIDTSKVDEIDNLIDDKLTAFRYHGDVLFTSEVLNSDASGYNTVPYYDKMCIRDR